MKTIVIGFLCLFALSLTACTDEPLDPTGGWDTVLSWTDGDCGLSGVVATQTSIARIGGSFLIEGSAGRSVTGDVACSDQACRVTLTETGTIQGSDQRLTVWSELTADEQGHITGSGYARFESPRGSCQQHFLASGDRDVGVIISP